MKKHKSDKLKLKKRNHLVSIVMKKGTKKHKDKRRVIEIKFFERNEDE